MKTRSPLLILLLLLVLPLHRSYAQSYGLGFYSHEVVQDQRTGLDLSPGETLCFRNNFEIAFDLTLFTAHKDYYGYVLRLVADNDENIDLIYDKNAKVNSRFKVVIGGQFSNIAFDIPESEIFSKWNGLKLSFNYDQKVLKITSGNRVYQTAIKLKKNSCFKILFGANEYLDYKTTDVPPMKIRNVSITESGVKKYFWPLNEYEGPVVNEEITGRNGLALKPLWVKKLHYNWQPLLSTVVDGPASVAFDAKQEILNIIADDSLISYQVKTARSFSRVYASGKMNLRRGNQSLVDDRGRLINFYIDREMVSTYDPETNRWNQNYPNTNITDFWLCNKFYSAADSSLYIIGGYGHFIYKNQLKRYHFPSGTWKDVRTSGDGFTPRYMAALGSNGDGAYILGGYGSSSGQQMLNPRNLYDLLYFDAKKKTIKKIYELKVKGEDFVFANSLIINQANKTYYALKFPKNKYQSSLQLIEGSLTSPEFKLSGSPIPYLFHDVRSYADLFYCRESKRFIAVTLYWEDNNRTRVSVYTLNAPPIDKEGALQSQNHASAYMLWYWMGGLLLLAGAGVSAIIWSRKKQQSGKTPPPESENVRPVTKRPVAAESNSGGIQENNNAVFLFGDLQVFDRQGIEITRQFTPLIKELFLVILVYSIRWERGISSEKLKELLWFDKTEESARNNRSVSIVKLKNIIDQLDGCTISKDTGYWKLNFDAQSTYIDYKKYVAIIRNKKKLEKEDIIKLAEITKRGSFLPNVNYEWMDSFKAEISNEIIDTYLHFTNSVTIHDDAELLIELASYIFYFDSVNEEAMTMKCKALAHLGKHTQAKTAYENFCKEYRLLYNADFDKGFNDVLNS